jgi:hypothetical protein
MIENLAPADRCSNSEPGHFNQECGKPAAWVGAHPSGYVQKFCSTCKASGWEARGITVWHAI